MFTDLFVFATTASSNHKIVLTIKEKYLAFQDLENGSSKKSIAEKLRTYNRKLVFLQPNTASKTEPMDQGVIRV